MLKSGAAPESAASGMSNDLYTTMKRPAIILLTALSALFPVSCTGNAAGETPGRMTELPLPAVPDSITDIPARADYVARHFWDAMDFADSALASDTALVEQSFSNFASILPLTTDSGRRAAVWDLLEAAGSSRPQIERLAEYYLYEPESPTYSEDAYACFLEYQLLRSDSTALIASERLENIRKNRVGTPAADFTYTAADGSTHRLLEDSRGAATLLFFYEPGCERCHADARRLSASPALASALAAGTVRVLMAYPGENAEKWRSDLQELPSTWEIGMAPEIDSEEIYIVRATPSYYLISPDGTVLLKDAPLPTLAATLGL